MSVTSNDTSAPPALARSFNSDDSRCHICQEEYDTGDNPEIPLTLSCGHVLGSICLSRWLHVPDRKHGCPMCRKTLFRARVEERNDDELMSLGGEDASEPTRAGRNAPQALSLLDDEMPTEMYNIFGIGRSTVSIIAMHRARDDGWNIPTSTVFESMIQDHRHLFNRNSGPRHSYREETYKLYDHIRIALRRSASWLDTRPAYNANATRELQHQWQPSLRNIVNNFRSSDRETLINLIKAGIFTAPRMEGSFGLRLMIAEHVSSSTVPFGDGENPAGPHMFKVLRAMPKLTGAYESIARSELWDSLEIVEYNFQMLWEMDMEITPSLPGPDRQTWDWGGIYADNAF